MSLKNRGNPGLDGVYSIYQGHLFVQKATYDSGLFALLLPFWAFSQTWWWVNSVLEPFWGLGCSLGVRALDPWPYVLVFQSASFEYSTNESLVQLLSPVFEALVDL